MSNIENERLLEKYYNEYLDEGLTPSESERLARLKLSEIDEDLLDIHAFLKKQANK